MSHMPFPSNDDLPPPIPQAVDAEIQPWKKLHPNEMTPMTFEIRQRSGTVTTFPYGDFRGTQLLNAGYLIVNIFSMEKYQVVVEGRNLSELAKHLSLGRVHWFGESKAVSFELPESQPYIETVTIVALTGTS